MTPWITKSNEEGNGWEDMPRTRRLANAQKTCAQPMALRNLLLSSLDIVMMRWHTASSSLPSVQPPALCPMSLRWLPTGLPDVRNNTPLSPQQQAQLILQATICRKANIAHGCLVPMQRIAAGACKEAIGNASKRGPKEPHTPIHPLHAEIQLAHSSPSIM